MEGGVPFSEFLLRDYQEDVKRYVLLLRKNAVDLGDNLYKK
jgi:hypothetical protein